MARLKSNISFGAFANLKNNVQNQIGLTTLITNLTKVIRTFNFNFAFIVNNFNLFTQVKYNKTDYTLFLKDSANGNSYNNNTIDNVNETIQNIKDRLDLLETEGGVEKVPFVPCEVYMHFKHIDNWLDSMGLLGGINTEFIKGANQYAGLQKTANGSLVTIYLATNNGHAIWNTGGAYRYWTKDLLIKKGMVYKIPIQMSIGVQLVNADDSSDKQTAYFGSLQFEIILSGMRDSYPSKIDGYATYELKDIT